MAKIDLETIVCISIAGRPSPFGMVVHNAAYKALGLNFIYKAFAVSDLKSAIAGVKALGIKGCSVTMPFKEQALKYVDELDKTASAVGAVNTIVNTNGRLKGYNTDVYGAQAALKQLKIQPKEKVLVLGAGGAAKAIICALKSLGIAHITIANRTASTARRLGKRYSAKTVAWSKRNDVEADVLINATCIGMYPQADLMPVDAKAVRHCRAVMDVVVAPMKSCLVKTALEQRKKVMPGYEMGLGQAMAQFELYTGTPAPYTVMKKAVLKLLQS